MPQRDSVEFTAAVALGTIIGAAVTYVALSRRRGRKGALAAPRAVLDDLGDETRELGETFLEAVRDEAQSLVRNAGGGILRAVKQRTPGSNGR